MGDGDVRWTITIEDMGPLVAALKLVSEELDRNLNPNYGIQVAADRAALSAHLRQVLRLLTDPAVAAGQAVATAVHVRLTSEEAAAAGGALLIASNRLDHFAGVEGARGDPIAQAFVLPGTVNEVTMDLVRRHFSPIAKDISWVRVEGLRLRIHAHRLLDHHDDIESAEDD